MKILFLLPTGARAWGRGRRPEEERGTAHFWIVQLLLCASLLLCIAGQQCRRLSRIFLTTSNSSLESSQQRRVIIHLLHLLLLLLLLKANFLSKSSERAAPGRHVVAANGRLACTSAGRDAPANQNLGGRSRDAQPANQSSAPGQVTAAASIPSQQPFHSHFP